MGYELHQLTKSQVTRLVNVRSVAAALAAQNIIGNDKLATESDERLVLLIWLISLIEVASELADMEAWLQLTDEECAIGYRLSIDSVDDLCVEMEELHVRVMSFVQEFSGRPSPQIAATPLLVV